MFKNHGQLTKMPQRCRARVVLALAAAHFPGTFLWPHPSNNLNVMGKWNPCSADMHVPISNDVQAIYPGIHGFLEALAPMVPFTTSHFVVHNYSYSASITTYLILNQQYAHQCNAPSHDHLLQQQIFTNSPHRYCL